MSFISKIGSLASRAYGWSSSISVLADPYYEYTTLLLPGNGTNGAQNNTFLDASTNNFTITRNGNTTQGTFSPFSQTGWGNYFDGTGDYLTLPNNAALAVGSGQFCIEFWIYPTSSWPTDSAIFVSAGTGGLYVGVVGGSFVLRAYAVSNLLTYGTLPTLNTWTHIAICRNSSNVTSMYFNGSRVATGTVTQNFAQFTSYIGNDSSTVYIVQSYLSNLRLIKGSAVYDPTQTTITVPTAPLTAITDTSILTCQSNRFIDNSTNNFTITRNGSPSVQAFSPFNPTASWSAATYGGSGYFDGTGDYLTVPDNDAFALGSNNWTIECWVYLTNTVSAAQSFVAQVASSGADATVGFVLGISSSGYPFIASYINGAYTAATASTAITTNQWWHIVGVRSSGTMSVFANGSRYATTSVTGSSVNSTAVVSIGASQSGSGALTTGYISSARIVNGTAVYDPTQTTLTVPTAPLTAITNTSLLLNFTNAGVYDATSKNDLETVGNAQISTTQSKWGGSSISFDGTGDWLLIPDQPPQRIGTGNFTVEMWVYRNSSGTYGLAGKGTGTTGWLVSLNSSNQVVFTYGSSTITSLGTVSATTWTHIAVVREGTSTNQTKIYIGGSNDGTGTVSTDFNQTNSMYIGADRTGGSAANAYVQDLRITNYARYTANFPAPTAAFPTL